VWTWLECEDGAGKSGLSSQVVDNWGAAARRYVRLAAGSRLLLKADLWPGGRWTASLRYRCAGGPDGSSLSLSVCGRETGYPLPLEKAGGWKWASVSLNLPAGAVELALECASGEVHADGILLHSEPLRLPDGVEELHRMLAPREAQLCGEGEPRLLASPPRFAAPEAGVLPSEMARTVAGTSWPVLKSLAEKPCPYLVKDFASPPGTDYNADTAWHLLNKEKLWELAPHDGLIGVVNPNSDLYYVIGISVDPDDAGFRPPSATLLHIADTAILRVEVGEDLECETLLHCARSDTLLVEITARNRGKRPRQLFVTDALSRGSLEQPPPQPFTLPDQKFGPGVETTAGGLAWRGSSAEGRLGAACFYEWFRGRSRGRRMLATLLSSRPADVTRRQHAPGDLSGTGIIFREMEPVEIPPGETRSVRMAVNLRRFTLQDDWNPDIAPQWYRKESEQEALDAAVQSCQEALALDAGSSLLVAVSPYFSYPALSVPEEGWEECYYACLELVRASTFSPLGAMQEPFYNFCRVHAHDPFNWWSYGMHAHESLIVLFQNQVDPRLSMAFLRNHLRQQTPEGRYPYGVSHTSCPRTQTEEATLPILLWECWQTYLWSGDRDFLQEAWESGRRNHEWWLRERDRCGEGLCHWGNYSWESARDDDALPTWRLTGGGMYQEALDLNCYLAVQEQTLAAMARELGHASEAARYAEMALRRATLMNAYMWHEEDRCYYGIGEVVPSWARARDISTFFPLWAGIAPGGRHEPLAALLSDPATFGTPYGPPTLARNEPGFGPRAHWMGANWVEMTLFVILGLRRYGYWRLASSLAWRNTKMVFDELRRFGHFREYFDSETGEGVDLIDYCWTGMPAYFLVGCIIGVQPEAQGLCVIPALPAGWEEASIRNLHIRGRRVSIRVHKIPGDGAVRALLDGEEVPPFQERGILVPWGDLRDEAEIEIFHPETLGDVPRAPAEAPRDWQDVPPHAYPGDPELIRAVRAAMVAKENLP